MPKPSGEAIDRPSSRQLNFLEILFNDCGFDRKQRNAFIRRELGRDVNYLDELTGAEAHRFITALKERRDDRNPKQEREDD